MSKIKGIFPLFLATTFGIFNGQCDNCPRPFGKQRHSQPLRHSDLWTRIQEAGAGNARGATVNSKTYQDSANFKLTSTRQQNEVAHARDPTALEILKEAETEANGAGATQRLDKPEQPRWSIARFWEQAKSEEERREAAEVHPPPTEGSKPS